MTDPLDSLVWWRKLVDAVVAFRAGQIGATDEYLAFVREYRGEKVAREAAMNIAILARTPSWADCHRWPAWGYQSRDPAPPPNPRKQYNPRRK